MNRPVRVAVLMTEGARYTRSIYHGVAEYARRHRGRFEPVHVQNLAFLRSWEKRPTGVIALVFDPSVARELQSMRLPVVNVSGRYPRSPFPMVIGDDTAIGRVAAEHLLDSGFSSFGYYGNQIGAHYANRCAGFEAAVREAGKTCGSFRYTLEKNKDRPNSAERRRLDQWLKRQEKPIGLFCGTDWCALHLYEACFRLGLRVRDDVALVAAGNDEFICESCEPPLSSVDNQPGQIGYEAAALMARLLRGEFPPAGPIRIPPAGVVQRRSSDVFINEDRHLATVLRFIQNHLDQPLHVADLVRLVPLSRRALERRVREALGRSILDEIHRRKMERIKHLLARNDQSIEAIATACGFAQAAHMTALFRKITGLPPSAYREQLRRHAPPAAHQSPGEEA
jgi:LacI family transcriptional regulator